MWVDVPKSVLLILLDLSLSFLFISISFLWKPLLLTLISYSHLINHYCHLIETQFSWVNCFVLPNLLLSHSFEHHNRFPLYLFLFIIDSHLFSVLQDDVTQLVARSTTIWEEHLQKGTQIAAVNLLTCNNFKKYFYIKIGQKAKPSKELIVSVR